MNTRFPTVEEICPDCGYYHSDRPQQAEEYHKSHGIPFKLVGGAIKSEERRQCAGCSRLVRYPYRYCVQCGKTGG